MNALPEPTRKRWFLPAACLPALAALVAGMALFYDPETPEPSFFRMHLPAVMAAILGLWLARLSGEKVRAAVPALGLVCIAGIWGLLQFSFSLAPERTLGLFFWVIDAALLAFAIAIAARRFPVIALLALPLGTLALLVGALLPDMLRPFREASAVFVPPQKAYFLAHLAAAALLVSCISVIARSHRISRTTGRILLVGGFVILWTFRYAATLPASNGEYQKRDKAILAAKPLLGMGYGTYPLATGAAAYDHSWNHFLPSQVEIEGVESAALEPTGLVVNDAQKPVALEYWRLQPRREGPSAWRLALLEGGLTGLALLVALVLLAAFLPLGLAGWALSERQRLLALGIAGMAGSFALEATLDGTAWSPLGLLCLGMLIGLAWESDFRPPPDAAGAAPRLPLWQSALAALATIILLTPAFALQHGHHLQQEAAEEWSGSFEALETLRKARMWNPFSGAIALAYAENLWLHLPDAGQDIRLRSAFNRALELNSFRAVTHVAKLRFHLSNRDWVDAVATLARAHRYRPNHPLIALWQVEYARAAGDGATLREALLQAIDLTTGWSPATARNYLAELANLYEKQGSYQAALEAQSQRFQLQPGDPVARKAIQRLSATLSGHQSGTGDMALPQP